MKNPSTPRTASAPRTTPRWTAASLTAASGAVVLALLGTLTGPPDAFAAEAPVGLGTAGSYSVLGGQTVTNTGPTLLNANLGVSPGTAITGFPPGVTTGAVNAGNAEALQAQADLIIGYNDAAGRAPTASVSGDLVGQTLVSGVYNSTGPLALSGTLTLDAAGDPNAVFIFQVASTLITDTASSVSLIGGAQACNVFWQVGSSATLGTGSSFKGSILALTSIAVTTGTVVEGRALARNGAVTLDTNTFLTANCQPVPTPTETAPVPVPTDTTPVPVPTDTTPVPVPTDTTPVPVPTVPVPTLNPAPAPEVQVPGGNAPQSPGTPTSSGKPGEAGDGTSAGPPAMNRGANIQSAASATPLHSTGRDRNR
ncbi:DUF3494 domain-containing protein [Arthrobacter frigidicola]|nr:DUF3494 domain-containing protein [Arthrobacter frigidicola]